MERSREILYLPAHALIRFRDQYIINKHKCWLLLQRILCAFTSPSFVMYLSRPRLDPSKCDIDAYHLKPLAKVETLIAFLYRLPQILRKSSHYFRKDGNQIYVRISFSNYEKRNKSIGKWVLMKSFVVQFHLNAFEADRKRTSCFFHLEDIRFIGCSMCLICTLQFASNSHIASIF